MRSRSTSILVVLCLLLGIGAAAGSQSKPWRQWSRKDATKILNDSGWGQTQVNSDISEMMYSPSNGGVEGIGALNQATFVNLYIRFISARPVRQAFARLAELNPGQNTPGQIVAARDFIDNSFEDTIVIAVDFEGEDDRFTSPIFQAFASALTSTLKNDVYLDVQGGRRVFLKEYQAPGENPFGAKFIFPRFVEDKPVIDPKADWVRFYAQFPRPPTTAAQPPRYGSEATPTRKVEDRLTISMRFKVSEFLLNGVLEY